MTVVRAPGVQADGGIGARGWRAHCPGCGHLGAVKSYRAAESELRNHACRPGGAEGGQTTTRRAAA